MMARTEPPATCLTCAFFLASKKPVQFGDTKGLCRRYPRAEAKQPTDWCGEHST